MPLTPQYDWSQTYDLIQLNVRVPGFRKDAADIAVTPCCIKVNFAPYILLLDLHGTIEPSSSSVTATIEGLAFTLSKAAAGDWERLVSQDSKAERESRRNAAFDEYYAAAEAARQEAIQRRKDEEKQATSKQWDVENAKRATIEKAKQDELHAARTDLEEWQNNTLDQNSDTESEDEQDVQETTAAMPDHDDYHGKGWRPTRPREQTRAPEHSARVQEIFDSSDEEDEPNLKHCADRHTAVEEPSPVEPPQARRVPDPRQYPCPRDSQPVPVQFTKLETDHLPAREQREEELKLYKKKIEREDAGDSVDITERQPVFLKDKGDAMFKQGNYRGAINAYSRAIDLDPQLPLIWANRAACQLKVGNHEACIEDCTQVLEMLEPATTSGRTFPGMDAQAMRNVTLKALARRGAARAQSSKLEEAVQDYTEALKLDPDNKALQAALDEIKLSMEPTTTTTVKARGDARFKGADYEGAVEAYTLLLQMAEAGSSEMLAAHSNRSACYLLLGRYQLALGDCNVALQLILQPDSPADGQDLLSVAAGLDNSKQRTVVRLLSRRGTAGTYLKAYQQAIDDYQAAHQLLLGLGEDGKAQEMQEDLQRVQHLQQAAAEQADECRANGAACAQTSSTQAAAA